MAYIATVVPVMIASPSDVADERVAAREAINDWNNINSGTAETVLLPVGWETHSSPDLAGRPQEIINGRLLDSCDLLIGIFWTRLGTPTGEAASGTVEEITKHVEAGKPAMVYFSDKPVVYGSVDPEQYKALVDFKSWCQKAGIVWTFSSLEDFRAQVPRHLQITINSSPYLKSILKKTNSAEDPESGMRKVSIKPEAAKLLVAAAGDPHGLVTRMRLLNGDHISAGGKNFVSENSPRETARWKAALDQLVQYGLIRDRGYKGEVFEVTDEGYSAVDQINVSELDSSAEEPA